MFEDILTGSVSFIKTAIYLRILSSWCEEITKSPVGYYDGTLCLVGGLEVFDPPLIKWERAEI